MGLRNKFGERTVYEVVSGERDALMAEITEELDGIALNELGIHVLDVRVKGIDLPPEVSNAVYTRMSTEREREARDHRSRGRELAEGIEADADRQNTVIEANAYREAEQIRGEGDAIAAEIYANALTKTRSSTRSTVRSLLIRVRSLAKKICWLSILSQNFSAT